MRKTVAIIGGGPAGMMLAAQLDPKKIETTIYDHSKALGRKFLVAGAGGFNLTHAEPVDALTERYSPSDFLKECIQHFDNTQLRAWLSTLGIETFVGSSQRVFPRKGIKPVEVLNAILERLQENQVRIETAQQWQGWTATGALLINDRTIEADITVFALGGGSWKVTGSDGTWLNTFEDKGIPTQAFEASNCAFKVNWPAGLLDKIEGAPLKNIAFSLSGKRQVGEVVITRTGIEGNGIYGLSPQIREALTASGNAQVFLDLKPTMSVKAITERFTRSTEKNHSSILRNDLHLSKAQFALLKALSSKEDFIDAAKLIERLKQLPISIHDMAPIDEAISTAGGLALDAVTPAFELKAMPNTFSIGEMLAWDAPTGGYLLQACFSMGAFLADHLNGDPR